MGCCDQSGGLLPVDEAVRRLCEAASRQLPEVEEVSLREASGRVLAKDVVAAIAVPPADNSAMDGYALRVTDMAAEQGSPTCLPVSQRIPAGIAPVALQPGTLARIFTGAVVPEGADAVVMQEDTRVCEDGCVEILASLSPGENIRRAGQDIAEGSLILRCGDRLGAASIGMLASLGISRIPVYRRLRVGVLSTGDELVEPGEPLGHLGQIYNSNRYLVGDLLQRMGCEWVDAGVVPDRPDATRGALDDLSHRADVIISTGGVSVGEEDHVKAAVEALGSLDFWKIAIKPGKPLAFGQIGGTPFLGLPGNPQSVWITFLILARPYLLRRQGQRSRGDNVSFPGILAFDIAKPLKRDEFLRVRRLDGVPGLVLEKHPNQSSGALSSSLWAEGLARIRAGKVIKAGETVEFYPFSAFGVA